MITGIGTLSKSFTHNCSLCSALLIDVALWIVLAFGLRLTQGLHWKLLFHFGFVISRNSLQTFALAECHDFSNIQIVFTSASIMHAFAVKQPSSIEVFYQPITFSGRILLIFVIDCRSKTEDRQGFECRQQNGQGKTAVVRCVFYVLRDKMRRC